MRKPTVPAVAGSMRRNSAGALKRPRSRASAQPSTTIATAAATRTGVLSPNTRSRSTYAARVRPNSGRMIASSHFARRARWAVCMVRVRARGATCGREKRRITKPQLTCSRAVSCL